MNTLAELDCADKKILNVYNKIDLVKDENPSSPQSWVKKSRKDQNGVYISAAKNENLDLLRSKLLTLIKKRHYQIFPNYLKTGHSD
jgi:GTP-binding protein HflX